MCARGVRVRVRGRLVAGRYMVERCADRSKCGASHSTGSGQVWFGGFLGIILLTGGTLRVNVDLR